MPASLTICLITQGCEQDEIEISSVLLVSKKKTSQQTTSVNWEVFRNRLRMVSERLKPNKGILFQISRYIWYIYIEKKFKITQK
jgi:hypothetical protein